MLGKLQPSYAAPEHSLRNRKRPHGESAEALHFYRHGEKPEGCRRQRSQVAQMFGDGNAGAQQDGMRRPRQVGRIVDIQRIDAGQCGPGAGNVLRRLCRQERMTFEVLISILSL